ncbi:MAG: SLBB domain-containing protein [Candidatus Zixiibacteriota bacterium]|nr:MAG: SLBB domain-containing protein [candidate division Zixibacteria bacterium]
MFRDIIVGLLVLFLFSMLPAPDTLAEAYRIGPEDVLSVKFWQDNSLDATVKVTQDGKISLDIIGEVEAVGLTTSELEREIVRQMSRYNKAISQAVVRVVEYGSQKVYISGQVLNPGKYTFEQIPDLWTLINEAGGVSESGDLTRVVIIRGGEQAGEVEVVNVARMVAEGRISELPKVRAGETIELSRTPAGLPARTIGEQPEAKNIFYVTGAVRNPGAMTLDLNTDILDAIALVGGPTDNADMKNVKIVSKDGYGTQLVKLDLTRYGTAGIPGRYILRPEDNVIVPVKSGGLLGMGSLADLLTLLGGVSTAVLIYTSLSSDGR